MSDSPSSVRRTSHREFWLNTARGVARRVNTAWWLERLSAPLLIAAVVGAAVLLISRGYFPELSQVWFLSGTLALLSILSLVAWLRARKRFETPEQAMVRIEAAMHMRNALSAADAGVAPWPEPVTRAEAGLNWHLPRLLVPPLGALALLAAGLWLPVAAHSSGSKQSPDEPQAWKQLDAELDHLAKEDVVDEAYLEDMRKRLEELRAKEEEQWFSHSSLEATDSLKKSHRSEMDRMEHDLAQAGKALQELEKKAGAMGQAEREKLINEFEQALQGLQNGAMKPNPALLDQLKQLDPQNLGQLDAEQLAQLRENLGKHQQAMKDLQGEGEGDWDDELLAGDGNGENGEDGEGPGQGGINRGPGHDPGVLGKDRDAPDTGDLATLKAKDLSRSTPGDLLQLQDGEHDVSKDASRPTQGGDIGSAGSGGDRVWRDSLDPDEQRTLKRFFD